MANRHYFCMVILSSALFQVTIAPRGSSLTSWIPSRRDRKGNEVAEDFLNPLLAQTEQLSLAGSSQHVTVNDSPFASLGNAKPLHRYKHRCMATVVYVHTPTFADSIAATTASCVNKIQTLHKPRALFQIGSPSVSVINFRTPNGQHVDQLSLRNNVGVVILRAKQHESTHQPSSQEAYALPQPNQPNPFAGDNFPGVDAVVTDWNEETGIYQTLATILPMVHCFGTMTDLDLDDDLEQMRYAALCVKTNTGQAVQFSSGAPCTSTDKVLLGMYSRRAFAPNHHFFINLYHHEGLINQFVHWFSVARQ